MYNPGAGAGASQAPNLTAAVRLQTPVLSRGVLAVPDKNWFYHV